MNHIRISEKSLTVSTENLHLCHSQFLDELKSFLEKIDVRQAISERSKSFKAEIEKMIGQDSLIVWKKQSVFSSPEYHDVPAGLQIDGRAECNGNCNSFHQINIVLCLNNREVIGTNFLKLEVSAKEEIRNHRKNSIYDTNILGVLITLDDSLLKAGNWDPAYANSNEYAFAFQYGYRGLIQSNIVAMQLHLV